MTKLTFVWIEPKQILLLREPTLTSAMKSVLISALVISASILEMSSAHGDLFSPVTFNSIQRIQPNKISSPKFTRNPVSVEPVVKISYSNTYSSYPDQNGGEYRTADMTLRFYTSSGAPRLSGLTNVNYSEQTTSQSFSTGPISGPVYSYYVGSVVLVDVSCSSPGNCTGSNYYYIVNSGPGYTPSN